MPSELEQVVVHHYETPDLDAVILAGLRQQGADVESLSPTDVAAVDEFHLAGRLGTLEAMALFPIEPGMHVLDAGSGIGGTARVLAKEYDCRVTGVDLTPGFVETARWLTGRMALADRCSFRQGSVLEMPFEDGAFDAALTFHVAMNIEDRAGFYRELMRVLKPGAPLCVYDIMSGPNAGLPYPVPWAETAATSFLKSRDETVALLEAAGFDIIQEKNLRSFGIAYFEEVFAKAAQADGPPPLGLHLLTGENAADKFTNVFTGLKEHQIEPVILIAKRR